MFLPGHSLSLHVPVFMFVPVHTRPPFLGLGAVQARLRVQLPPPQLAEHGPQPPHRVQPP